jgi:superfamily II DNA/RNA helicase
MESPTFADLGVSKDVCSALAHKGITAPFPIQVAVVADAMSGRDVLVQSPTGSGKTLAFGLPVVERITPADGQAAALILVPTRELAAQVAEELFPIVRARGLRIARAYGGVSVRNQARFIANAHVLVATPGRLEDLVQRRDVRLDRVKVLVLDEADRMLDMGFQPAVDRIVALTPRSRQTMFFSATLVGRASEMAKAYTTDASAHAVAERVQEHGPIEHRFLAVTAHDKVEKLVELLVEDHRSRSLVFVRTRHGADRLVEKLKRDGVRAGVMHGAKTQAARERALDLFTNGRTPVLVATDVAARGIDVDDVARVINFDPPEDTESYVHRIGRTGRAGKAGIGITFVMPEHSKRLTALAEELQLEDAYEASGLELHVHRPRPNDRFHARSGGSRGAHRVGAPSGRRR